MINHADLSQLYVNSARNPVKVDIAFQGLCFFRFVGEIGGSMGLFLGCSLLTICEFFDFLVSFLASRNRQTTHPM